jgi:hypothetical protein
VFITIGPGKIYDERKYGFDFQQGIAGIFNSVISAIKLAAAVINAVS